MRRKVSALSSKWRVLGVAASAVLGLSGCASTVPNCACLIKPSHPGCQPYEPPAVETKRAVYVLAEARFGAALGKPRQVEISKTKTYDAARDGLRSAAVRPPDNCLSETAAKVQGEASQSSQLASTDCGVWLSEIEKGLVQEGFRVVSWDALRTIEKNERVPPYKAAKKLGADVLFLFNSLELSQVTAGGESAYRIEYFSSNAKGQQGAPFPMTESERSALRSAVKARAGLGVDGSVGVLSSTLDTTAILTSNGESIWFYRNTAIQPTQEAALGRAFLFGRYEGEEAWYLASPYEKRAEQSVVVAPEKKSAVDTGGTVQSATRDPAAMARLELMRAVTHDFVERFRTGRAGDTAEGAE